MWKVIITFCLASIIISCSGKQKSSNTKTDPVTKKNQIQKNTENRANLQVHYFLNADNTFGYDIHRNGKRYIHQPNIPAVPGTKGFLVEQDAKKVAGLTIFKINNNILPPTITVKELDSLGIQY